MPKGQGIFKMPKNAKRACKFNSAKGQENLTVQKGQENSRYKNGKKTKQCKRGKKAQNA